MKKILFVLAAMICVSFTAKAQFYVGGTIGFGLKTGEPCTVKYGIEPEAGYRFNDKYTAGMSILLGGEAQGNSVFRFRANPYFRWSFINLGPLKFFADGTLSLGTNTTSEKIQKVFMENDAASGSGSLTKAKSVKSTGEQTVTYTTFGWGVAISPGLLVDINNRLAFVAHFASIGVSGDAGNNVKSSTASFDLAVINGPSVGIHYYF